MFRYDKAKKTSTTIAITIIIVTEPKTSKFDNEDDNDNGDETRSKTPRFIFLKGRVINTRTRKYKCTGRYPGM